MECSSFIELSGSAGMVDAGDSRLFEGNDGRSFKYTI